MNKIINLPSLIIFSKPSKNQNKVKLKNRNHSSIAIFLFAIISMIATSVCFVSCEKGKSNEMEIISFYLSEQTDSATIDKVNNQVAIEVNYKSNLSALNPEIEVSEKASVKPNSGDTIDFSNGPVTYTVTAEDSSSKEWKVTVTKATEMTKKITAFSLEGQLSEAVITDSTVQVNVSSKATLTALVPTITVSEGTTISPASGSPVDFSNGTVNFTLTGSDGSTKTIAVTVSVVVSTGKEILSVSFPGQVGETVFGTSNNIYVYFPYGTDFKSLVPTITISENATISPVAGVATDFSKGYVQYSVTSEEGKTAKYKIYTDIVLQEADNSNIQYVGRMNYTTAKQVKFSAAGAYIKAKFTGTYLDIVMADGSNQNYVQVFIDDQEPIRLLMLSGKNTYNVAKGLTDGEHTVLITKDTEASIGILDFYGFHCDKLLPLPALPTRKIECFGNSITAGACMLTGEPCEFVANGSNWNAANCAYLSYGALTARALNAQYHITAWSGIGMIHSCCDMANTMPDVYDRVYLDQATPKWDFTQYVPDVVTICLGQNDGAENVASQAFKDNYVAFINKLRSKYPNTTVFLLTSPMADDNLLSVMNTSLQGIIDQLSTAGDKKIFKVELPHGMNSGCSANPHPNAEQHAQCAKVLTAAIGEKMGW
jgi:lysophospholipase L1-like esterase